MGAAEALRARLKARGVKQKDLAAALGVGHSLVSLMLSGKRGIAMWHLDAIAKHLDLSVPALFGDVATDRAADLSDQQLEVARRYRDLKNEKIRNVVDVALGLTESQGGRDPQREIGRVAVEFQKGRRR